MSTTARTGGFRIGPAGVGQRSSHARLTRDVSSAPAPSIFSRAGRLDALVVPATRPVSFQRAAIELAADVGALAVLLCSGRVRAAQVAEMVKSMPGARVLAVDVPEVHTHPWLPSGSSVPAVVDAAGGRRSNLSLKRNLGLLLARRLGWNKIVFLDDDITFPRTTRWSATEGLRRLAAQLDHHQIVGMRCSRFPDNSVVCHARRLAKLPQDVFVTGAVLGVNCADRPIPFFPDVYNEDWFFFADVAARRELRQVGEAIQAEYDPFLTMERAQHEEFGDLLAEGLYSCFEEQDPALEFEQRLDEATESFWSRFQEARSDEIQLVRSLLQRSIDQDSSDDRAKLAAYFSLEVAATHLKSIQPSTCLEFIAAWRDDLQLWKQATQRLNPVSRMDEALDELGLSEWRIAEFGNAQVERGHLPFSVATGAAG